MGFRRDSTAHQATKGRLKLRVWWGGLWPFLWLSLALYLVGLSNDSEPAHFISRILLFVPIVSLVLGLVNMSGITCNLKHAKQRLQEGQNASMQLRLTNYGSLSKLNFLLHTAILNRTLNIRHRWVWFIQSIAGEQSADAALSVSGLKRGENEIEYAKLVCESPLKIFVFEREYFCGGSCIVYPRLLCDPESIINSTSLLTRALLVQDPFDYRGVREYVPTDDLRLIHWMSSARRGELVIKVLERYGVTPCTISLS
ncbi:MAG: DUF58 domain-containing protein, partial [Armatimonadetes bacterium]|nr:DUF58 domain-containing protein [Armatimonadota bacterium]